MKDASTRRRVWVECAVLAGLSALIAALMHELFGRYRPTEPILKNQPGDSPSAPWEKPKSEEKAKLNRHAGRSTRLPPRSTRRKKPNRSPNGLKNWQAALPRGKSNRPGSLRSPARSAIRWQNQAGELNRLPITPRRGRKPPMGLSRQPRRSPPDPAANAQFWLMPPKRRLILVNKARQVMGIQCSENTCARLY